MESDPFSFSVSSLPRRALLRLAEIVFGGELLDSFGVLPHFHEEFWGPHAVGYMLLSMAISILLDLVILVTQPDMRPSCLDAQRVLPLEEER